MLQCGFLLLENYFLNVHSSKKSEAKSQVIKDLAALILQQWYKSNAKFTSPVIITEVSLVQRLKRLWEKAESVCWGHVKANIKEKFFLIDYLILLFALTPYFYVRKLIPDAKILSLASKELIYFVIALFQLRFLCWN